LHYFYAFGLSTLFKHFKYLDQKRTLIIKSAVIK
jgi:hypothetical protein